MNATLKQILEMSRAGTITDEQAAALIDELLREPKAAPGASRPSPGTVPPFASFVHSTVNHVLDHTAGMARAFHGSPGTDGDGNELHLSHADVPRGRNYIFRGNQLRMSKMTDLKLDQAEMSDTKIDASRLDEIRLTTSRLVDCDFNSSSVTELRLAASEISDATLVSSKVAELTFANQSSMRQVRLQSSVLKECRFLDRTLWEKTAVEHSVLVDIVMRATTVSSCGFRAVKMKDVLAENCTWRDVSLSDLGIDRTAFIGCTFDHVSIAANSCSIWKKRNLSKVHFENCQLSSISFNDCRLADSKIRDVRLDGITIEGLDLSHQTIVGNDAFLRAIEHHRK